MLIPSVLFIEIAVEACKRLAAEVPTWPSLTDGGPKANALDLEIHEFRMLGTRPDHLDGLGLSDRERGYLIGLETARAELAMMPAAVLNKVTL